MMKISKKLGLSIVIIALILIVIIEAGERKEEEGIKINSCSELNVSGATYILTSDIINVSFFFSQINPPFLDFCIGITKDDIILDCQNHIIDGKGFYDYQKPSWDYIHNEGIWINGTNITVKNCILRYWNHGIDLFGTEGSTFNEIALISNSYGLSLYYSDNNIISDSIFRDNQWALYFSGSYLNNISNSRIENNSYGVFILGYEMSNLDYRNLFYNNLFNNSKHGYEELYYGTHPSDINMHWWSWNYWNTSKQTGVPIYGGRNQIGGNYWTHPTHDGYSDTCTDDNKDGFCDFPYNVTEEFHPTNIDYFPLAHR